MQVLRLNEVLMRVVAWHNRHPLARRISASQVHSVGEVVLPFASAQAKHPPHPPPVAPGLPAMPDLLAPPAAALGDLHAPAQSDHPGDGLADQAAPPTPAPSPVAAEPAVQASRADTAQPAAALPHPPPATPATAGLVARLLARLRGWRRGTGARGLPRLQATFSQDFIWPLRPGQVARWARRHGSLAPLAPADWPQRRVDSDGSLQAQAQRQGLPHQLPLHLLAAAIGVGDRRIRVLIDGRGHILGPRSYSPPKLATLASVVALGLLGAGWGWLPRGDSLSPQQASAAMATAASAAALAASAANQTAAAASAAEPAWPAQQAESLSAGTALAAALDGDAGPAVAPAVVPAVAPAASPPVAGQAMPAAHSGEAVASAPEAASAPDHAPASAQWSSAVVLGNILPALSPAAKQTARLQAEALRSGQAAAIAARPPQAAGPVFAIVTHPTREKESAARGLSLIRASGQRLKGEAPEHGELMHKQGEWRAAWWPFESQADAERARVMLAARGLKVEVVAF